MPPAQQLSRPRALESICVLEGMEGMRSAGCFCCHSLLEAPSEATEEVSRLSTKKAAIGLMSRPG